MSHYESLSSLGRPVRIGEVAYSFDNLQSSPALLVELGLRLDPLRTLVVQEDADAAAVAGVVDAGEISHIVVRSPQGPLTGIVVVDWATGRIAGMLDATVKDFQSAITAVQRGGIRGGSYHHEWLTTARPPLIYCRGGHWADADPCDLHKK